LRVSFDSAGVHLRVGGGTASLALSGVGYGSVVRRIAPARPAGRANEVSYDRGSLVEWYRAGPLGLEQGFTLARRPMVRASGPLTLSVAVGGTLVPRLSSGASQELVFTAGGGRAALRYGGLSVTDARGRRLRASLSLARGRVLIRVSDRGAVYPLRVDPFVQQGGKLVANDSFGTSNQGQSVAVSADGNTVLVGGSGDNGDTGAAWVFVRSGSTWSQQGPKLVGSDAAGVPFQGQSVALSADGNTAVVGGWNDNSGTGAAWVYTRSGTTWSQQGPKLVGSGASGPAHQGFSVAVSGDGNTALVGGPRDDSSTGAVWVFVRSGTTWSQQGSKLVDNATLDGGEEDGYSVALSGDGETALVGSPYDQATAGGAWVFTRSTTTWSQQGSELVGSDASGSAFQGDSVALSGNGNTALIGGDSDEPAGAAWVFTRSGTSWSQDGSKLVGSGAVSGQAEGASVALSSDGATALIAGPSQTDDSGAAWVFTNTGTGWTQQGSALVGSGAANPSGQGASAGLSGDGETALVGGPFDGDDTGAAWVFTTAAQTPPTLTVALSGGGSGTVTSSDGNINCGSACTHSYPAGTMVTLTATPAGGSTFAGWSGAGCSGTGICQLTLSSDQNVTATFNTTPKTATTTTLSSSSNPAIVGQIVTYTATVSAFGAAAAATPPGGVVAFTDGASPIAGCGAVSLTEISSLAATASCQTTYSNSGGGVGFHPIAAAYSGVGNYAGSQSPTFSEHVELTSVTLGGNPSSTGTGVRETMMCSAPFGDTCLMTDALTTTETTQAGEPVAVSSARRKRKHRTVVVGTRHLTIRGGQTVTVTVNLNATGRKLLKHFRKLPVTLTVSLQRNGKQVTVANKKVTIKPSQKNKKKKPKH
jgi:Bacterial Ig-like domain (group 3)/Divergent InlB B-repeat domain